MGKRLWQMSRPYLGTRYGLEMDVAACMLVSMLPTPGVERRSGQWKMRQDDRLVRVLHTSLVQASDLAVG